MQVKWQTFEKPENRSMVDRLGWTHCHTFVSQHSCARSVHACPIRSYWSLLSAVLCVVRNWTSRHVRFWCQTCPVSTVSHLETKLCGSKRFTVSRVALWIRTRKQNAVISQTCGTVAEISKLPRSHLFSYALFWEEVKGLWLSSEDKTLCLPQSVGKTPVL